jgi:hypothetical protein
METAPAIAFRMVTKYHFHDLIGICRKKSVRLSLTVDRATVVTAGSGHPV